MLNKIWTGLMIVVLGGWLAGCMTDGTLQPTINKYHVILAPDSMYNCPQVTKWPAIKTLTDLQVARQMVQMAAANNTCRSSMNALHKFYANAAAKFGQ